MDIIAEKKKKGSHFTYEERLALEYYLNGTGHFPKISSRAELAEIMGKSRRTIEREIARGTVEHETSVASTVFEYNADYAQQDAEMRMTAKGAPEKLGRDFALAQEIGRKVRDEKRSPYAIVADFNLNGWPTETRLCEKTIYNYIAGGLIFGVSARDLPNKGARFKAGGRKRRFSRAGCALRSISNRPQYINDRAEFGHWEIDTVKGRADTTSACALTLTERKGRAEIIRKMADGKADSVVRELDELEKKLGTENFKKLFKSITADGGSEFMDFDGIEKSCLTGEKRTTLYFAHPYCASERGTNENHNRMMRRFFPKGTDFTNIPPAVFIDVQDWMNNYPRKILEGLTPAMILKNYMGVAIDLSA